VKAIIRAPDAPSRRASAGPRSNDPIHGSFAIGEYSRLQEPLVHNRSKVHRAPLTRYSAACATVATLAVLIAARPVPTPEPGVSIIAAKYTRLNDGKRGPTITAGQPLLEMPRSYTYRVTLTGNGIDLVQTITPGNASSLVVANVRRRNGLETKGPGELLFDVTITSQATIYQRIPITFRYVTGQTDRMYVEVHPAGRVTSMSPQTVPADQPVIVTYEGTDLSSFVLSGSNYSLRRVVERTVSRVRIEYVFPADGPTARYVTLGSKETGPFEIFAFAGQRAFSITAARPKRPAALGGVTAPTTTKCVPTVNNPCP
jgi:hypothetical protein